MQYIHGVAAEIYNLYIMQMLINTDLVDGLVNLVDNDVWVKLWPFIGQTLGLGTACMPRIRNSIPRII